MKILDKLLSEVEFKKITYDYSKDTQWAAHLDCGSITVLHRLTGFIGEVWDTETGFRDPEGKFWLASCDFDIRKFDDLTVREAITKIKEYANTCTGD